jgi:sugar phosphate isomerase/epimerase/predicted metal-dependent hydrolase
LSDQLLEVFMREDSAVTASATPDTPGMTHMRAVSIGASSGAFYPHTPTELVPAAAAMLGIRSIELMLQTASEYQPEFIDQVAANARAAGVRVHAIHTMHSLHPMFDSYARRAAEGRALFQQGIAAAAKLGAKILVWHGAKRQDVATEEGWGRFIALTTELARACGEAGVTLAIENVSWCALAQVRHVVQFATRLNAIGSPEEIGFVFDPFQAVEAGANPFMMLAAMGNRIVDVHISDYREQDASARHLVPGDGDLPWSALIRAIAGSGYSGPMMIEGPLGTDGIAIARVRDRLNPLIRSVFDFAPDAGRHEPEDADPADREADSVTLISMTTPPAGILHGIELFNARQFYEQHEAIEHEWHAERGAIRWLYQGILQIGVGFHHALNGNQPGAVRLLTDGIAKTSEFTPQALGIETGRLIAESQRCLDRLNELGPERIAEFDASLIPVIAFS